MALWDDTTRARPLTNPTPTHPNPYGKHSSGDGPPPPPTTAGGGAGAKPAATTLGGVMRRKVRKGNATNCWVGLCVYVRL